MFAIGKLKIVKIFSFFFFFEKKNGKDLVYLKTKNKKTEKTQKPAKWFNGQAETRVGNLLGKGNIFTLTKEHKLIKEHTNVRKVTF